MATNQPQSTPSTEYRVELCGNILVFRPIVALVTALKPAPKRLWCDECHYWHAEVNECAYVTKASA